MAGMYGWLVRYVSLCWYYGARLGQVMVESVDVPDGFQVIQGVANNMNIFLHCFCGAFVLNDKK